MHIHIIRRTETLHAMHEVINKVSTKRSVFYHRTVAKTNQHKTLLETEKRRRLTKFNGCKRLIRRRAVGMHRIPLKKRVRPLIEVVVILYLLVANHNVFGRES